VSVNPDTKFCPHCGREIKTAARLCRFCGARFDAPAVIAPPAAPAPPAAAPPEAAPASRKRSRTLWIVLPLAIALLIVTVVGGVLLVRNVIGGRFSDAEMAYARPYVRQDYKGQAYVMQGLSLALQAEQAVTLGGGLTKDSLRRGHRFFNQADAYFKGLLALKSPSARLDELHALWLRAVRLQRSGLKALAYAYDHAQTAGAWKKGKRLTDSAEAPDKASSNLFDALLRNQATAAQIGEVAGLMRQYDKEMHGQ
jgi:hypothetical protein